MKNVSPSEITNSIKSAKNVSYIPAGAKGIDKLKYAVCRGLRKAVGKTKEMRSADVAILSALGGAVLVFACRSSLVLGEWVLPTGATVTAATVASLPVIGEIAAKAEKPLRNLEAALLKRMRNQTFITNRGNER
mgnify:CR=1 FL=1